MNSCTPARVLITCGLQRYALFIDFASFSAQFRKKMKQGEKLILCTPRVFRESSTSGTKIIAFAFCGWTNWIIVLATESQTPTDFLVLVFVYKQRMAVGIRRPYEIWYCLHQSNAPEIVSSMVSSSSEAPTSPSHRFSPAGNSNLLCCE